MTIHAFATRSGSRLAAVLLILCVLGAGPTAAQVPGPMPYQGLLLDDAGQPLTDTVDLAFAIYDGLAGGAALWTETHAGVLVVDGVYAVKLGSTTPIPTGILSGGARFLEISVEGEILAPRQQLLAVPYARVAEIALNAGGASTAYLEQVLEDFPFDGSPPGNQDPEEGLGDIDADGIANFIDADNDGDSIDDAAELANGTSINVVSPRISQISPSPLASYEPVRLQVTGSNLGTVQTVTFGAATPSPVAISQTGFQIDVTPGASSTTPRVGVVIANGQPGSSSPIPVVDVAPTITNANPSVLTAGQASVVVVQGTHFAPGTTVTMNGLGLPVGKLSATSLEVTIPALPSGSVVLNVNHPNGLSASTSPLLVTPAGSGIIFLSEATFGGNIGGIASADATCQAEANAASLTGTFRAWLSDTATSPATRLSRFRGPYVLASGQLVANDWNDLTNGSIARGISVTAAGADLGSSLRVWTGTQANGQALGGTNSYCSNWTTTSPSGNTQTGLSHRTDSGWTTASVQTCNSLGYHIYCIQD